MTDKREFIPSSALKFFVASWGLPVSFLSFLGKCFRYVAITIFEIDIMKNSSPINLNLCQT